jgi:hypothetical protein
MLRRSPSARRVIVNCFWRSHAAGLEQHAEFFDAIRQHAGACMSIERIPD